MVDIHRFLVPRVFLSLRVVYIHSKVVVVQCSNLLSVFNITALLSRSSHVIISHLIGGILTLLLTLGLKERNIGQRTMSFYMLLYSTPKLARQGNNKPFR